MPGRSECLGGIGGPFRGPPYTKTAAHCGRLRSPRRSPPASAEAFRVLMRLARAPPGEASSRRVTPRSAEHRRKQGERGPADRSEREWRHEVGEGRRSEHSIVRSGPGRCARVLGDYRLLARDRGDPRRPLAEHAEADHQADQQNLRRTRHKSSPSLLATEIVRRRAAGASTVPERSEQRSRAKWREVSDRSFPVDASLMRRAQGRTPESTMELAVILPDIVNGPRIVPGAGA